MCLKYSARDPPRRTHNADKERSRRGHEEEEGEEGKGEEERKHLKIALRTQTIPSICNHNHF